MSEKENLETTVQVSKELRMLNVIYVENVIYF